MHSNIVIAAKGTYSRLRPGIITPCALAGSVEYGGNLPIRQQTGELPNDVGGLCVEDPAVLTVPRPDDLELRVIATLPVQK